MNNIIKIYDVNRNEFQNTSDQVRDVLNKISYTELWFEMEEDKDLIESCIYQQKALKARYRYLVRKSKEYKKLSLIKN